MTRAPLLLAVGLLALVSGCGGSSNSSSSTPPTQAPAPAGGGGAKVVMKDIRFEPRDITVKVGEAITWTNEDSVQHDVAATSGAQFKSDLFGQGGTFSYTPTKAGTIKYVCTVHPGMDGTITVTG